jgi:NitT/TauT family transport system substrate-binding protein
MAQCQSLLTQYRTVMDRYFSSYKNQDLQETVVHTIKKIALLSALFIVQSLFQFAQADTKIVLGYTGISDFAAAYVAKEEGFFKKYGLDVELQLITLTSNIPPSLQSDSIQIGGVAPSVLLQAAAGGLDLVAIAGASLSDSNSANPGIVVKNGSFIRTPQDFIGSKIGVPGLGGALHVLTRRWLTFKGVDYRKVTFIEVPFPQMNDVLKGGTIDAAVVADPFMSRIAQSGVGTVLVNLSKELPDGFAVLLYASTREWANKNHIALDNFRKAIAEAVSFAEKNPQLMRTDIGKYVKVPPPVLATLPMPRLAADISPERLNFWIGAMQQQGMFKGLPDFTTIVAK